MKGYLGAALWVGGLGASLGCSGPTTSDPSTATSPPTPEVAGGQEISPATPPGAIVLGEFIGHYDGKAHTFTIEKAEKPLTVAGGLRTQSFSTPTIYNDGTPGTGPAQTLELVTNTYVDSAPATWSANVTLRHFMQRSGSSVANQATRTINNVFIQVRSVTCVSTCSGSHAAINSDDGSAYTPALDSSLGLWEYTSPNAQTTGVVGAGSGTSGENRATRDWIFNNPDDASTTIVFRALANTTYSSYAGLGLSNINPATFVDACTSDTVSSVTSGNFLSVTPTFATTFFQTSLASGSATSAQLRASVNGTIAFGNTLSITPDNSCTLPGRGIYPFWDRITYNSATNPAGAGRICYAERGSAPNRQQIFSWQHMKFFTSADGVDDLNFSVIISEGTDDIDMVYPKMSSTTNAARAAGSSATVGVSNTSTCSATSFQCLCNDPNGYQASGAANGYYPALPQGI